MLLRWIIAVLVFVVGLAMTIPLRRHFPGPPSFGLLGSYMLMVRNIKRRHRFVHELHEKFGPCVELSRLGMKVILVYRPEHVKFVMTEKEIFLDRPNAIIRGFECAISNSLLALPANEQWANHRHLLSPLFTERFMKEYVVMISDKLARMSDRVRHESNNGGGGVDVLAVLMSAALDIIGICGFGVNFNAIEDPVGTNAFEAASTAMFEEVARFSMRPAWLAPPRSTKLSNALLQFHSKLASIRAKHDKKDDDQQQRKTMMSELLRVEREGMFNKTEVDNEMLGMLVAGHETTAATVAWAIYYVARDRELQRKLQIEVDKAFAQQRVIDNKSLTMSILSQLPLVKSTMLEALRLRPTLVVLTRVSSQAFSFPDSDIVLPQGTIVSINLYSMAMNKNVWGEDCEKFIPERHRGAADDEESPESSKAFAFLPFGGGPRQCIGRRFAMQEGVLLIARLLRDFDVELPPNATEPGEKLDITLKPVNLRIVFNARK